MRIPNIIFSVGAAVFGILTVSGTAFAEGRYVSSHDSYTNGRGIYLTDTKKGRIKWCIPQTHEQSEKLAINFLKCTPWTKVED